MKLIIICLLTISVIQILSYSIKEIVPGDTQASLNLLFQGNVDISYYDITTSAICSLPLSKIDHEYLQLYTKDIPIVNTPNNYLISQAYRLDYYLNPTISNNPNALNTHYVLDCKGEDPYRCTPKTSDSIVCLFGLRMSTYSVISLTSQMKIDFGFIIEFSYLININDEIISLFHTNNVNSIYNDFIANGNSVSFALNSFYLKAVLGNDHKLTVSLNIISNTGTISEVISISKIVLNDSKLNKIQFKLEYNQKGIEECLTSNSVIIKRMSSDSTYFLRLSINHQVIACICLNLLPITITNAVNVSFIGKSNVNLLLMTSLFTDSYDTHCSIVNKRLQCDLKELGAVSNNKLITVQNISQYNRDSISFLYSYYNNQLHFCQSTDGLIIIDSSYTLGLNTCPYTISYPIKIKELFIKNNHITLSLNALFPIKLTQVFFPSSLYNLCVDSKTLLLDIGYCSCELCLKSLEITSAYHQISKCYKKYNQHCNCFDQSLITPSSPYAFSILSFHLCTECYINDNCSSNNKNGKCNPIHQSGSASVIKPDSTITSTTSKYLNQNILYGHCSCGTLSSYHSLNNNMQSYTVYYDTNSPIVLSKAMISCIECLYQTNNMSINVCLRNCVLFQITNIEAYHVPFGGYQCTSCVLSSEFLQVIRSVEPINYSKIKDCIENYPETFYSECMPVIKAFKYPSNQVFSGLLTHFRVECPGRPFATEGSVCIPWFGFNDLSYYTIIYKKTDNNAQWDEMYQCLNDKCEPSTKADCLTNPNSCVCYDSCAVSKGKYFNSTPIPCSGNGVCTNQSKCICDLGYIEPTCEKHCSETKGGCCIDGTDCLHNASLHQCKKNVSGDVGYCDT